MNPSAPYVISNPQSQAAACREHQLLKQEYESALREVDLYESRGAASIQQSLRYQGEAKVVSDAAGNHLAAHSEGCPVCRANRA